MLKQEKRKSLVNQNEAKKPTLSKKKWKHFPYLQKVIKNSGRPYFNILPNSLNKKNFLRTDISLFPNNVFCSIKNTGKNKLLYKASAGKYKVKVSKKNLKYASNIIITNFFRELKKKNIMFNKPFILVLVAPSNLKKRILLNVLRLLKHIQKKRIAIFIKAKKVFNGCRAKKQIRKKQKRYAIYK